MGHLKTFDPSKVNHSRIKAAKKFSVPKERRELKFNSANGEGKGDMMDAKSTFKKLKVELKFNKEKRELKFPTPNIVSKW